MSFAWTTGPHVLCRVHTNGPRFRPTVQVIRHCNAQTRFSRSGRRVPADDRGAARVTLRWRPGYRAQHGAERGHGLSYLPRLRASDIRVQEIPSSAHFLLVAIDLMGTLQAAVGDLNHIERIVNRLATVN